MSDMIWKIRQDSDRVCHVKAIIHKFTNKATVGQRTQVVGSVSGHGCESPVGQERAEVPHPVEAKR